MKTMMGVIRSGVVVKAGSGLGTRVRFLVAVPMAAALLALPGSAHAASNYTWTGTGYKVIKVYKEEEAINGKPTEEDVGSDLWSTANNWQGEVAPSGSVGALIFPELESPSCKPQSFEEGSLPCYRSDNDISGIAANAMFLALGGYNVLPGFPPRLESKVYNISGKSLTLGEGGLNATPQPGSSTWTTANLELPIILGAPQTWSISGKGENEGILELNGPATGESSPLEISLNNGVLAAGSDLEAGPISVTGGGSVNLGNPRGPHYVGTLNGRDGNPVTIGEGVKVIDENTNNFVNSWSIGALTLSDFSTLRLGQPELAAGVNLGVNGGLALSPASKVALLYNSHIHASGPVNLNEAQLVLEDGFSLVDGTPTCNVLDEDALVSTSGTLTGTFRGIPNGALIHLNCEGLRQPPVVRVNYSAHAVTATLIQSTTTELRVSDATPSAGEQVTYTATVTPQREGEGLPTGSVEFRDGNQPIDGCSSQPLVPGELNSTASCTVSYSAAGSHAISTGYLGSPDFATSSSADQGVTVVPQVALKDRKRTIPKRCRRKHGKARARCIQKADHHRHQPRRHHR